MNVLIFLASATAAAAACLAFSMPICSPYAGGGAAGCCAHASPTTSEAPSNSEMNNTLRIVILPNLPPQQTRARVSIGRFPTDASVQSAAHWASADLPAQQDSGAAMPRHSQARPYAVNLTRWSLCFRRQTHTWRVGVVIAEDDPE